MNDPTGGRSPIARGVVRLTTGLVLWLGASCLAADDDAAARFKGAPTYDLAVTNVKWEAATKDYSYVTFDLSWSWSWRAKWVEPAATSCTGKDIEVENWDAAWVFLKFLPNKDSKESIERNHWQHASLDTDGSHHVMPAGATNTVGVTIGGDRGLGVYIHRAAIGHGANNFKGVKLRWLHGTDKVDPTQAAIKAHVVAMIYVPEGPFRVGCGADPGFPPFTDGPTVPVAKSADGYPLGNLTDGAWRGGPTIPFLVDAEWNKPVADGTRARRLGPVAGQLWGTLTYAERMAGGTSIGTPGTLNDEYPTGYEGFYCMKYPTTQGQYADFLNSLPPDVAATRAFISGDSWDPEGGMGDMEEITMPGIAGHSSFVVRELDGFTIHSSAEAPATAPKLETMAGKPDASETMDGDHAFLADAMADPRSKYVKPPVYTARLPFRRCSYLSTADYFSYAVWAGLRPMTELEFEKACRGPARAVVRELTWGEVSDNKALTKKWKKGNKVLDLGMPTERYDGGLILDEGQATRVGNMLTADSDRQSAGATYWGLPDFAEIQAFRIGSLAGRAFRGTPGDGRTPAGKPGAPPKRIKNAPAFETAPKEWGEPTHTGMRGALISERTWIGGEHMGGTRHARNAIRLVGPSGPRRRSGGGGSPKPGPVATAAPVAVTHADSVKVTNIKVTAGAEPFRTITFDLAWDNSWRAAWEEPADKNVTGKPLKIESWDAAWVFVKFLPPGASAFSHATLDTDATHHAVPADAALQVGASDDGARGMGVFISRKTVGRGANAFKNIAVRWLHTADGVTDPATIKPEVYAVEMVYVPEGPFQSKSVFGGPLTLINTADATREGGYLGATNSAPERATWPNGYRAFYVMKNPISQGQYVALLNTANPGEKPYAYNHGRYTALCNGNVWRYGLDLTDINGYTITRTEDGVFVAKQPERPCNFLSWPDIISYTAWAGLRPPTCLEYEKACRGPRAVAREADAWTGAVCGPAVGLGTDPSLAKTFGNYGASYWGIPDLSLSGCVQEWPALIRSYGGPAKAFAGTHGKGIATVPDDWPWSAMGDSVSMGQWQGPSIIGIWVQPEQMYEVLGKFNRIDCDRTGRFGARAARTAPQ